MKVVLGDMAVVMSELPACVADAGQFKLRLPKSEDELKADKTVYDEMKARGLNPRKPNRFRFEQHDMIAATPDGSFAFLPGLWPRVQQELDGAGIKYVIEDLRSKDIRPAPDYSALADAEFRPGQAEALALIASSDCGIIKCATAWGKSFCISKLCRMFPTLNIVVTTSSSQVVGTLYDRIKQECPDEVGLICGTKNTAAGKRIICCTLRSLEKVNPEGIQLVLVDEVHGVGANQAGLVLSQFVFARRFGFSASPVRNDGSAKALEAIMGPVILDVSYADAVSSGMVVPLKYVMLPCNRGPEFLRDIVGADGIKHRKGIPDVFRKKFSYWRNSARNRQIANCVHRILEVDPDCQILVIVETLQHAVLLHQLIPNFLVAHYGASSMDELADDKKFSHIDLSKYMLKPKELDRIRGAFAKGTLRRVISTFVFRQGVDFKALKVIIRADGRLSEVDGIQIPGRVARLSEGKDCGYIIDLRDTQDEWAQQRAQQREQFYQEQGWTESTIEEMLDDIRRARDKCVTDCTGDVQGNESEEDSSTA